MPKVNLVITHGLGEHSDAYNRLVHGLEFDSANVFAWDLRGHGNTDGRWGVVSNFLDYCRDLKNFVTFVREELRKENNTAPIFLVGHSMGGLITTRAVIECGIEGVAGVILSSPLFGVALAVPVLKERAGKLIAKYLPDLTLFNEIKFQDLTRDREVIREYERDTLRHDRISLGLFTQLNENMEWAAQNSGKFKLPLFVQQAGADHVVSSVATQKFFNRVSSTDREIILYDGYYHEIYNDIGREHVFRDLKNWLCKRI